LQDAQGFLYLGDKMTDASTRMRLLENRDNLREMMMDAARILKKAGYSNSKIAMVLGVDESTVRNWV